MRKALLVAAMLLSACTVGDVTGNGGPTTGDPGPAGDTGEEDTGTQQAPVEPVDEDGDGVPDGLDLDGDGVADIDLDDLLCDEPLLDGDGDGVPDGVDLDCDGAADLDLGEIDLPELPPDLCIPELIDEDGDGFPDGLDVDCDGVSDFSF